MRGRVISVICVRDILDVSFSQGALSSKMRGGAGGGSPGLFRRTQIPTVTV